MVVRQKDIKGYWTDMGLLLDAALAVNPRNGRARNRVQIEGLEFIFKGEMTHGRSLSGAITGVTPLWTLEHKGLTLGRWTNKHEAVRVGTKLINRELAAVESGEGVLLDRIRALRLEAREAGDRAAVKLCESALHGDRAALDACRDMLAAVEAQDDD